MCLDDMKLFLAQSRDAVDIRKLEFIFVRMQLYNPGIHLTGVIVAKLNTLQRNFVVLHMAEEFAT